MLLFFGLLAVGLVLLLHELLLCPVRPGEGERLETALRVRGEAPGLEQTLRGLLWLRKSGRVRMEIVIIDEGMEPETRRTAELLCADEGLRLLAAAKTDERGDAWTAWRSWREASAR